MILAGSDRQAVTLAGEVWLVMCGAVWLVLFALSMLGIQWSRATLLAPLLIVFVLILAVSRHTFREIVWPRLGWQNLIDLFTLVLVAGYVRLATAAQPVETDYLTIWGVTGKEFWLHRGIHWHFLATTQNPNTHVDYPILVPLVYAGAALLGGAWPVRMIGAITAAFGLSALLVVRGMLAGETPKLARAIATAVLVPVLFSPFFGLAEGPLIAYAVAGLLFVRRGIRDANPASVTRGAVYLGLAASCKAEGLAIAGAVIVAMLASRAWKLLPRLWPALALPLPWIVLVRVHDLTGTHVRGGMLSRVVARLADPAPLIAAFHHTSPGQSLFWIGALAACAIGWRRVVTSERFLAVVSILIPLSFIAAYLGSTYELDWLVRWSWDRIIRQVMPVVALLALFSIRDRFPMENRHASDT
jgi:hypothetical protein